MATKTKTTKGNKATKVAKKINNDLVTASMAAISTTLENGEKWQKLASKLIKQSEKVRKQQINMVFDTAEAVKGQMTTGAKRALNLVGYDAKAVEKAMDYATNNPVSRKVVGIAEDVSTMVSENPMVKKAEKTTSEIKAMGMAKYNEVKEDVLDQASKIINKGEAIIEEAKATPKKTVTKKTAPKKTTAKKAAPKKTTAKKATPKKTVAKKITPKKTVAKKVTPTKAKTTKKATKVVAKAKPAAAKKEVKAKVNQVKKVTTAKVNEVKAQADVKIAEVKA